MIDPNLQVRLVADDLDGGWVAECIDLPGCFSQGETKDEALTNLEDAIHGVLAEAELADIDRRLAEGWVPESRPVDEAIAELRRIEPA